MCTAFGVLIINPILLLDNPDNTYPELDSLRTALAHYIDEQTKKGVVNDISMYYRDMRNGHWTGINEDDTYAPSSMLKVIVMMAYLNMLPMIRAY